MTVSVYDQSYIFDLDFISMQGLFKTLKTSLAGFVDRMAGVDNNMRFVAFQHTRYNACIAIISHALPYIAKQIRSEVH